MNIWISSRDFMSSWKSSGVSTDFFPVHQRRSDYKRWCFKVFPPRKSPGPRGNEEKGIRIWVKQRMIGGFKMLKKWIRALFFVTLNPLFFFGTSPEVHMVTGYLWDQLWKVSELDNGIPESRQPQLLGGFSPYPNLKNHGVNVSWDLWKIPNCFWKVIIQPCSSHHQPV